MKVIIDISEELYNRIFVGEMALNTDDKWELEESVRLSVMHGKVLPKTHGRLIDCDNLLRTLNKEHIKYDSDVNYFLCYAPTIIEADKEGQT